jgi:hypothetical protein
MPLRRTSTRGLLPLLVTVLVASGCGGGSSDGEGAPSAPVTTSPFTAPTETGSPAPGPDGETGVSPGATDPVDPAVSPPVAVPDALRFDATLLGGAPFDPETLAGRPVALWFWAPG